MLSFMIQDFTCQVPTVNFGNAGRNSVSFYILDEIFVDIIDQKIFPAKALTSFLLFYFGID